MSNNFEGTINRLTDREVRAVVSGLSEVTIDKLAATYKGDPATWAELVRMNEVQADVILKGIIPALQTMSLQLNDEAPRRLLLALAEHKDFEPFLRPALERRLLATVDPIILGPLLVLLLSVKWKLKVKKSKEGNVEFEFEVSKNATPSTFLRPLLARLPGFGSVSSDANM
jgi:hypothetical protein